METLDTSTLYRAIAFLLSGALGTFLLLPQRHAIVTTEVAHRIGYALVGIAAVIFGTFWAGMGSFLAELFFYCFGFVAVVGAILTVTSRNPIYSALYFAAVVLSTSGLFLLAGAQFLAAGTIIVYAGAIIVTFLFVIMLAQMEGRAVYDRTARAPVGATLAAYLLLFGMVYALLSERQPPDGASPEQAHFLKQTGSPRLVSAARRLNDPVFARTLRASVLNRAVPSTMVLPVEGGTGPPQEARSPASADPLRERTAPAHVAGLGAALYTEHLVTVELVGALLFIALIGALTIAAPKAPVRPATTDALPSAGV